MATQKPISTISYNTEAFLKEHLDAWVDAHIIQAYQYICHVGEDGDKDHIHVRIEPNKKLDPMDLTETLKEYTREHEKPLGVRPWRFSKEEDWYLYVVHDEEYLKQKYGGGEKGEKLPYDYREIKVSEGYDLEISFIRAKAKQEHTSANLITRMREGETPSSLIMSGENVFTVNALMRAMNQTENERLRDQVETLSADFRRLYNAVVLKGYSVIVHEGWYELRKEEKAKTTKKDGKGYILDVSENKSEKNAKKARKKLVLTDDDEWMTIPVENPLTDE